MAHASAVTHPGVHDDLIAAFAEELALRDPDGTAARAIPDPTSVAEQAVARVLLASHAWTELLGPLYDVRGVMQVLGVTKQAVSKRHLLALTTGSGRVVYPAFQFTGGTVVPGLPSVLALLTPDVVSPWTLGAWLASPADELDGDRPIDVLAAGETAPVLALAGDWARALAA